MQINTRQPRTFSEHARRDATSLLELAVASAVLAFLLTTTVQMLRLVSDQQRATDRRRVALQTVQNIAERIENVPYDELDAESAGMVALPVATESQLGDAQVVVNVFDEAEPASKRALIELTWRDHRGHAAGPVRLTTWSYPNAPPN